MIEKNIAVRNEWCMGRVFDQAVSAVGQVVGQPLRGPWTRQGIVIALHDQCWRNDCRDLCAEVAHPQDIEEIGRAHV